MTSSDSVSSVGHWAVEEAAWFPAGQHRSGWEVFRRAPNHQLTGGQRLREKDEVTKRIRSYLSTTSYLLLKCVKVTDQMTFLYLHIYSIFFNKKCQIKHLRKSIDLFLIYWFIVLHFGCCVKISDFMNKLAKFQARPWKASLISSPLWGVTVANSNYSSQKQKKSKCPIQVHFILPTVAVFKVFIGWWIFATPNAWELCLANCHLSNVWQMGQLSEPTTDRHTDLSLVTMCSKVCFNTVKVHNPCWHKCNKSSARQKIRAIFPNVRRFWIRVRPCRE